MKHIVISAHGPSFDELLRLAREDNLIIQTESGEEFILAELDDMDRELALIGEQETLMTFLQARSQEKETLTLREVRQQLRVPD